MQMMGWFDFPLIAVLICAIKTWSKPNAYCLMQVKAHIRDDALSFENDVVVLLPSNDSLCAIMK